MNRILIAALFALAPLTAQATFTQFPTSPLYAGSWQTVEYTFRIEVPAGCTCDGVDTGYTTGVGHYSEAEVRNASPFGSCTVTVIDELPNNRELIEVKGYFSVMVDPEAPDGTSTFFEFEVYSATHSDIIYSPSLLTISAS